MGLRARMGVAIALLSASGCARLGFQPPGSDGQPGGDSARREGPIHGDAIRSEGLPRDLEGGDGPRADGTTLPVPGTWVVISAGTFMMGSPSTEPCRSSFESQRQVTLTRKFEIQTTETTQAQFKLLLGSNPSSFQSCGDDCPVEMVNWHESVAYCNALSARRGLEACYTCTGSGASVICQNASAFVGQAIYTCPGYRLPTEAEWEYAYRAGTTTAYYLAANPTCNTCPTDVASNALGWHCGNAGSSPHPVGGKPPNAWGLYDMAGNVYEWTNDRGLGALMPTPVVDPWGAAPNMSSEPVYRGGGWKSAVNELRAAERHYWYAHLRLDDRGFRCVRTLP